MAVKKTVAADKAVETKVADKKTAEKKPAEKKAAPKRVCKKVNIELQYGENDYNVIFDAVDKLGYKGACGLEYSPLLDPVQSLKIAKEKYGK